MASNPPPALSADPSLDPNAAADPSESSPADAPEDDMSQGYCIEISVLPDGTFTVDSEPLAQEAAEENATSEGAEGAEPSSKPYKSIGEAFKAALMIFQNNGQDVDEQGEFDAGMSGSSKPTPKSMNY